MKSRSAKQPRIIGSAVEFSGGQIRQKPCYGTFMGDMPDRHFRFNISFVAHDESFPMHGHEYSELMIVLGGSATHCIDNSEHPLVGGDVFVINGSTRHGFKNPCKLRLCNIMYDPRQFLADIGDLNKMNGFHAMFELKGRAAGESRDNLTNRLHLTAEEATFVRNLLSMLKTEFESSAEGRRTLIKAIFLQVVAYLSRLYVRRNQETGTILMRMANVVSHIQRNYTDVLRAHDLARLAHWSTSQFQRNFKRIYNTTPRKFITQVRLHAACDMLKDVNQDITTVAMQTGFASSAFFSAQFKRHLGQSPSQFRRRNVLWHAGIPQNGGTASSHSAENAGLRVNGAS